MLTPSGHGEGETFLKIRGQGTLMPKLVNHSYFLIENTMFWMRLTSSDIGGTNVSRALFYLVDSQNPCLDLLKTKFLGWMMILIRRIYVAEP